MSELYLVQMHGRPGSGKSTLARAIGAALPAVVLDKDVISSALLKGGMAPGSSGPASYEAVWDLSESLLDQGYSVVVDSPSYWKSIEERGRGLARRLSVTYRMIEVEVEDDDEIDRRLTRRSGRASNPTTRLPLPPGASEPTVERLTLDGTRSIEQLARTAVAYIRSGEVPRDETWKRGETQASKDWTGKLRKGVENRGIWNGHP
jgi:predicted kinase